jgi:phosphomannomutase/phosphoglucomutase
VNCDVDGNYPNHYPDPSNEKDLVGLAEIVKQQNAEIGIAFDDDGDRIGVVEGDGNIISPDKLLVLFAQDVVAQDPQATVIADVRTTTLFSDVVLKAGATPLVTSCGYSMVKNKLQDHNAKLAGEYSGHFIFKDRWFGFEDGLYAAIRLLELLAQDPLERSPAEAFAALPQKTATPEILIAMAEGEKHRFIEQLQQQASFSGAQLSKVDGIRAEYPDGWGVVRACHTSAALSLRFEADSDDALEQLKEQFKQEMLQVKPTLTLTF